MKSNYRPYRATRSTDTFSFPFRRSLSVTYKLICCLAIRPIHTGYLVRAHPYSTNPLKRGGLDLDFAHLRCRNGGGGWKYAFLCAYYMNETSLGYSDIAYFDKNSLTSNIQVNSLKYKYITRTCILFWIINRL